MKERTSVKGVLAMNVTNRYQSLLLKSIEELTKVKFKIPFVQRGYRWKATQVSTLVDDLITFRPSMDVPFYFLNVLSLSEDNEVIDGQQRLTTLSLLLESLNKGNMQLTYARSPQGKLGSLDNYFRNNAKKCILDVLSKLAKIEIERLTENVLNAKFIVHKIPKGEEDSTFRRLNRGKIFVSDSELIKCVLLTPQGDESVSQTLARASEWDVMERTFQNEEFFSFITPRDTWKEDDRMSILLRIAGINPEPNEKQKNNHPFLAAFQRELKNASREMLWQRICSTFAELQSMFHSPLWHSAVGWGVHLGGVELKSDLRSHALKKISEITAEDHFQSIISDDDLYHNKPLDARRILALFNVAICWKRGDIRYPFEKHRQVKTWSLEHLFARNQRAFQNEIEFKDYCNGQASEGASFEAYCKKPDDQKEKYLKEILGDQYPVDEINGLCNLALLGQRENSSLLNGLLLEKESRISEMILSQTGFVPPATELVFHKAYPKMDRRLPYLSEGDMTAYVDCIKNTLGEFVKALKEEGEV